LTERLEGDGDLLEAGAIYLAHDAMTAERVHRTRSAPTPKAQAARRVAEQAQVRATAAKARQLILLDMPVRLLSGEAKQLRYVTGRELAELGGVYQAIAEKVGPDNFVGEVLVEAELKALLQAAV
jgi:hypothetical protein